MGHFIDFYLEYDKFPPGNSKEQATTIIEEANKRIKAGCPGVAITYSANYGQAKKINQTYDSGDWNTGTSGSNQADVMREMELLLSNDASTLQGKLQIAPITTLSYEHDGFGTFTHEEVVRNDLKHIKHLLDENWDILGWINQSSNPRYAVGGGVVAALPKHIDDLIQNTLSQFAANYSEK